MKTDTDTLLAELAARGVIVTVAGDRLKIDAPSGAITPALRLALTETKEALLAHLRPPSATLAPDPAHGELVRIPLDGLSEHLAARGLRVVGGTPSFGGATFRPVLFLSPKE